MMVALQAAHDALGSDPSKMRPISATEPRNAADRAARRPISATEPRNAADRAARLAILGQQPGDDACDDEVGGLLSGPPARGMVRRPLGVPALQLGALGGTVRGKLCAPAASVGIAP